MTTELSYRYEGANVYAQDGTLVCIAVDPLDAEVIAGLLRWKVDIHPEPAPEPDPWPTEPLIVATREGAHLTPAHRVWARSDEVRSIYTSITDSHEAHPGDTLTNVIPVKVVPVAKLEALRDAIKALGYETTGTTGMPGSLLDTALNLLSATDALGLD